MAFNIITMHNIFNRLFVRLMIEIIHQEETGQSIGQCMSSSQFILKFPEIRQMALVLVAYVRKY